MELEGIKVVSTVVDAMTERVNIGMAILWKNKDYRTLYLRIFCTSRKKYILVPVIATLQQLLKCDDQQRR